MPSSLHAYSRSSRLLALKPSGAVSHAVTLGSTPFSLPSFSNNLTACASASGLAASGAAMPAKDWAYDRTVGQGVGGG